MACQTEPCEQAIQNERRASEVACVLEQGDQKEQQLYLRQKDTRVTCGETHETARACRTEIGVSSTMEGGSSGWIRTAILQLTAVPAHLGWSCTESYYFNGFKQL